MTVNELLKQFHVLVIDEHRPRADAVDPDRVLLLDLELGLGALSRLGVFWIEARCKCHSWMSHERLTKSPLAVGMRAASDATADGRRAEDAKGKRLILKGLRRDTSRAISLSRGHPGFTPRPAKRYILAIGKLWAAKLLCGNVLRSLYGPKRGSVCRQRKEARRRRA